MDLNDLMMPVRTEEQEKIKADRRARNEVLQRFAPPVVDNDPYSLKDNKQYLGFWPSHSDEWMSFDVWDTETAVKLITIGYPIDLNANWWDDNKIELKANWWDDIKGTGAVNEALRELTKTSSLGNDEPLSLFDSRTLKQFNNVYSRALRLAESSIARGKLKAIDTPLNWLAWANGNSYNTDHLDPLGAIRSMEYVQSRIDYENCNAAYRKEFEIYQEHIKGWQKVADIWGLRVTDPTLDIEPAKTTKPRRKRLPIERETNEGLLLVDELLTYFNVEYLDELKGIKAWGKITSKEFSSSSIKYVSDAKKTVILASGEKLHKSDFLEKYRKRFIPE